METQDRASVCRLSPQPSQRQTADHGDGFLRGFVRLGLAGLIRVGVMLLASADI